MQPIRFSKSMLLFAMPSFIGGAARVLDLGGTFDVYNDSLNGYGQLTPVRVFSPPLTIHPHGVIIRLSSNKRIR
jgi:hypothetical protein